MEREGVAWGRAKLWLVGRRRRQGDADVLVVAGNDGSGSSGGRAEYNSLRWDICAISVSLAIRAIVGCRLSVGTERGSSVRVATSRSCPVLFTAGIFFSTGLCCLPYSGLGTD